MLQSFLLKCSTTERKGQFLYILFMLYFFRFPFYPFENLLKTFVECSKKNNISTYALSSSTLSGTGSRGQQTQQRCPDVPLPDSSSNSSGGRPRCSQASRET
ncbi:hypothetical protein AMECASPLE_021723 [Ameca splendens]|uniref:Uncharacterized protein n=1 Tax=Ameca splendens TaxID=208324 RepID=A0ABV0XGM5_9TELE